MTTNVTCQQRTRQRGHTLLELIAASTLVSIAIVSTLSIMAQSLDLSMDVENRKLVTTLCVSKMEEHLADCTRIFTPGVFTGTFAADGYSQIRFSVVRDSTIAAGGIPNELMAVVTTVWFDNDGNGVLGSAEPSAVMRTKVANLTAWEI